MSQQHFNDDIKLRCEKHPQYAYCSLYLEQGQNKISRLLCTKCTANAFNNNQILQRVVPLQDFLDNSANSIKEIFQIEGQEQLNQETLQQLEDDLQFLETNIRKQISEVRQKIQEIKNLNAALDIEISQNLKLDGITQDFHNVKNLDIHQGTVEFKKLQEKLEILSQNLTKSYIETTKQVQVNFCQVIEQLQQNLEIISNQISKFACDSISKLQTYNVFPMPLNIYDDLKEFPLIHKQISEGKKIEYQLIYQFSTDGLQYWQKCNNQSNLLTIMISKNGQKFGGYSPCQIIQNKNNFIQDPSMRSFIFQYNKKEIYPLKVQEHAIYSHQNNGPTFGQNCDIYIGGDFKQGHTLGLGVTYDTSKYFIADKDMHIFGDKQPNLVECKVYKIIYK